MKICYPVTTEETTAKIMGMTGSLSDNLAFLHDCGFDGVELMIRDPEKIDIIDLIEKLEKNHLTAAAVGVTPMVMEDKLTIASPEPSVRKTALERSMKCIDFAKALHAPFCIGSFRGSVSDDQGNAIEDAKRAFSQICAYAAAKDTEVFFEPQISTNGNYLNSIPEGLAWIRDLNCKNLKVIMDVFHIDASGQDLFDAVDMAAGHYGLVHLCDRKRLLMGFDNLQLVPFLQKLKEQKYTGFISTEIKQLPTSRTAAKMTAEYFNYVKEVILQD